MAFEIARQLEQKGEKTSFLSIFGSLAPNADYEGRVESFTIQTEVEFIKNYAF